MPWIIAKQGNKYCVYKKGSDGKLTGKTKGCHSTRKEAQDQIAALHASVLESANLAFEDIKDRLRAALEARFPGDASGFSDVYIRKTWPDEVIYERAGKYWRLPYTLDDTGEVTLSTEEEVVVEQFVAVEEHAGAQIIASNTRAYRILESVEETPERLVFEGCVLIDEVLSRGGNGRYYSKEFNDSCMEATNLYLSVGGVVTIYSRHGRAAGETGRAPYPTGLPVGRLTKPLWRKGSEILYEAMITPTAEGKDVMVLIRDKVLLGTSLRASRYSSRMRTLETNTLVEEMISAVIVGIDLCDQAGIEGAGVRRVLEETPQWKTTEEEEETMDFSELTLEELTANRQDLLDAHSKPLLATKDAELAILVDSNAELKGQLTTAQAAQTPTADVGRLAVLEASCGGLSRIIADKLTAEGLATTEAIGPRLAEIRAAAVQELLAESATPAIPATPAMESAAGQTRVADTTPGGAPPAAEPVTRESLLRARVLSLAGK